MTLLGGLSGYAGSSLAQSGALFLSTGTTGSRIFISLIFFAFIVLGLWMLGVIKFAGFNLMTKMNIPKGSGALGAFFLGLPFGIAASPCTFPVTVAVLLYVATKDVLSAMVLMFIYTIGRSIPIMIAGTSVNMLKRMQRFSLWQNRRDKATGIIMIGVGLIFFIKNQSSITNVKEYPR